MLQCCLSFLWSQSNFEFWHFYVELVASYVVFAWLSGLLTIVSCITKQIDPVHYKTGLEKVQIVIFL